MTEHTMTETVVEEVKCEVCGSTDTVTKYKTILFCAKCLVKEKEAESELRAGEKKRVEAVVTAINAQPIENITVKSDYFNAEVQSIVDLKAKIDADPTITNKDFELAKQCKERFEHLQGVLLGLREEENKTISSQKALQTHLNQIANKLREEERNILKLRDINYKPGEIKESKPKGASKPRVSGPRKFDKDEVNKVAAEYGLNPSLIQTVCVARNVSPKDAAQILAGAMSAKAQDSK